MILKPLHNLLCGIYTLNKFPMFVNLNSITFTSNFKQWQCLPHQTMLDSKLPTILASFSVLYHYHSHY